MEAEAIKRVQIEQADITALEVDAIVNAANRSLLGGGGVDGAIHRKAGPGLLAECRGIGGCPTGEARLTRGYRLPADNVIHTVGPVFRGRPEDRILLSGCYHSCLGIASDNQFGCIAFPAISCGAYGYPIEDASRVALETTIAWLAAHIYPKAVIFALFSENDLSVYTENLSKMA